MQDAIIAAVFITFKDTFFNKKDFTELIYQATFALLDSRPANTRIFLVKPAIEKPQQLWTGKQLVSNVIKLVVEFSDLKFKDAKGLSMESKTKINKSYM
jgi:DNA-directed RNA polymerase I subunit RPA1